VIYDESSTSEPRVIRIFEGFYAIRSGQQNYNPLGVVNDGRIVSDAVPSLQVRGEALAEHKFFPDVCRSFRPRGLAQCRLSQSRNQGHAWRRPHVPDTRFRR
jgi:hypothetical protein